jgi:hypothetical protein
VDTSLNQSVLSAVTNVKLPDVTPPSTPVLKAAKASTNEVNIEWLPILAEDMVKIEVYRKTKEETDWTLLTSMNSGTKYTDSSSKPSMDYQYKIRAADDSGNWTEYSNIYNVRTKSDTSPEKGAESISANYQKKKKQVTIKWKEEVPDRKGSIVFRKANNGRLVALSPMITKKAVFIDKKINEGSIYTYVVKTYYNNGKVGASSPQELVIGE